MRRRRRGRRTTLLLATLLVSTSVGVAAATPSVAPLHDGPWAATAPAERGEAEQLHHPAAAAPVTVQLGTSIEGRAIEAVHRRGSPGADRTVVAVGVIHGDETHGRLVTDRLLSVPLPSDLDLWVVPSMNPDGEVRGSHQNSRGVDLNRNWPAGWETGTHYSSGRYYSGSAPGSERETQVMMDFLAFVDPEVTVWFHSPWNRIDCNVERVGDVCLDYAEAVDRISLFSPRPGTATDWVMTSGLGVSFVVEFAHSAPSTLEVNAHVDAVLGLS